MAREVSFLVKSNLFRSHKSNKNDWPAENTQIHGYGKKGLSLSGLEPPPLEHAMLAHPCHCTALHKSPRCL